MFNFFHINLIDILDILFVAVIIFYAFRLLKGSQAMNIFIAIVTLYALRIICSALEMRLMSGLLGAILDVGLIAIIIIFQPEIRHFLSSLGKTYSESGFRSKVMARIFGAKRSVDEMGTINEICKACEIMSEEKCGALIVIRKENPLSYIIQTGDIIDAKVSQRLLRNLFFKNSPLHDGAVIIDGDRVVAARCTLPITEKELPASFGMRHKAAVGISENADVKVVVVSEETGGISVMEGGGTRHATNINDLKLMLQNG